MAVWQGFAWNDGTLWGPLASNITTNKHQRKKSNMRRQPFFPKAISDRPEWFHKYLTELPVANGVLGLAAADVAATVADAKFLEYASGAWLTASRDFGPACTSALEGLYSGAGGAAFVLPVFTVPALPAGVVAVPAGALDRIFAYVQVIKANPNYTEAIGLQLGIVGAEDSTENPVPTFTLKVERGDSSEVVKIIFRKYGRPGVAIYCRRGGGAWELLAIDLASPYLDARPLLAPGVPETREYRLQYYEAEAPVGDFTAIASVSVAP
jgi:hypothetical protein